MEVKSTTRNSSIIKISMHLAAWIFLIILPQYFIFWYAGGSAYNPFRHYFNAIGFGIIFYVNYLYLVPRFYLSKRKVWYFILAIFMILALYLLIYLFFIFSGGPERISENAELIERLREEGIIPGPPPYQIFIYNFFLNAFIVTGFALGIKVLEKQYSIEQEHEVLQREKLNSELAFLKEQISPHFFFNTLNNIYSLINIDQKRAGEAVHKLSRMMRYLLYESDQQLVNFNRELKFMRSYIDLMKIRLSSNVEINVSFPERGTEIDIPPLLFIPLIENAFKHGISYSKNSQIDIALKVIDNRILFYCNNSKLSLTGKETVQYDPVTGHGNLTGNVEDNGIGLENVRRRLDLLYRGRHEFRVDDKGSSFHVFLSINIKS